MTLIIENESGYFCVSDNFHLELEDITSSTSQVLYPARFYEVEIEDVLRGVKSKGCAIRLNAGIFSSGHRYRLSIMRLEKIPYKVPAKSLHANLEFLELQW
jgi:hypothetical protein